MNVARNEEIIRNTHSYLGMPAIYEFAMGLWVHGTMRNWAATENRNGQNEPKETRKGRQRERRKITTGVQQAEGLPWCAQLCRLYRLRSRRSVPRRQALGNPCPWMPHRQHACH